MRFRTVVIALALLGVAPLPARAQFLVGPNLEWSYWSFKKPAYGSATDSGNIFAIGGNYLVPGLRLGYLLPGGRFAVTSDLGLQSEHVYNFSYTRVVATPGLTYFVAAERTTTPYVGASVGILNVSTLSGAKTTRAVLGGAFGVRCRVASGHGAVRAEARFEHYSDDNNNFGVPQNTFGIRLGADLFVTK